MWREPSEADSIKSALEKDSTAAGRSSIRRANATRRPSSHTASRARRLMSTFHSQMLDEIQRGIAEPQLGIRSPVLNLGVSEDGLDLDASRREALSRGATRSDSQRRSEHARRSRSHREFQDYLVARADAQSRNSARPHLTPGFAPAVAYRTSTSPHPPSDNIHLPPLPLPSMRPSATRPNYSSLPSAILRDSRNGNALSRMPRDSTIDGLGDRQRSPSPDVERENDAWETLLSTITPDANPPSTDTSFSSMVTAETRRNASTLASSMLPPNSAPTSLVHLALDPYPSTLHPCDLSSSDEDDEDTPVNYHRYINSANPTISLLRPGVYSTMSSHPPIPTISFSLSDSGDTDLQQMRAILDRLARREDIPDDWWAGAGLSRTIGRGLNAGVERNETEGNE